MAGILDNEFMKVLLSGSPYMKSRQEDAIRSRRTNAFADEWGGILGSKPQAVTRIDSGSHPGLLSSEEISPQYQVMEGGSGYMGGEMNKQEYDQRVALAHARQFANPNMASNIFTQDMSGRQAMQRQEQDQDYYNKNMTAYQTGMLSDAQLATATTQQDKNFAQAIQVGDRYDKDTAIYDASIRGAEAMDELFPTDDYKISGSAQLAGLMRFMKQANDGGAFMSDDMENSARANGFRGKLSDLAGWITGSGFKQPEFMKDMHKIMANQATADAQKIKQQRDDTRDAYGNRFTSAAYDAIFSRSSLGPSGTYTMPSHLATKPVDDAGNWVEHPPAPTYRRALNRR